MADKNTADIGFEKQIWDAACVLRGNMDASEYKNVVLGLIFLKYISDRFDDKYQELIEEGDGFEEDIDEYTSEGIFFVPAGARWSEIAAKAHTPEIGTVIDDAMRAIEKENKRLKDILPKNFARPELDKRRLGDVVDLFTNIQMIEHGSEKDILGRTYEYCLSMFAEQEGKYSLETYDVNAFTRILFESLDKRIMNLSPAVKKEYKKLYVAYKLDTNFVDIVFQKQRLRISINMKFSEINDPNGICKDITGLGRWGNGDVELFMEHQDELDQIMEIVKQSFDAQAE